MAVTLKVPTIFTAVDRVSATFDKMSKKSKSFTESLSNVGTGAGVASAAIIAPLAIAANSAIKFEDKMSDIAKTTGLSGKPLDDYGKSLLKMSADTRTSIEDLQKIGEIGGQLGVAEKDLLGFTEASNKFAVALGSDYGGGVEDAISQVGKIKGLFKDTRSLNIADVINKSGSAINQLGAVGSGTSENINDFILRIGALPDAIKPSLTNTAALGTFFEEMGIDSQIASGGLSNFFLVAGKNIGGFAQQMGITTKEAKNLLSTDPSKFATQFATSLNGLAPDKLATKLDGLKIGSQETIKVLGALGAGTERLTKLQKVSAKAFEDGTSLTNEYNTKNNNTAANIAKAKNNIEAFAITLGTQLLPIISQVINELKPTVKLFTDWVSSSPNLAKNLLYVAGALSSIWAISRLVSIWVYASSVAMGVFGAVSGTASIAIGANTIAMGAYNTMSAIMTGLTWLANSAFITLAVSILAATWPILAVIAAVLAIIYIFVYWDEICTWFSKQWTAFTGYLGKTWDNLTSWFENFSFVDFFQNIGASIVDFMLLPLKSVLKLASFLPGKVGEMAAMGLEKLKGMTDLHVKSEDKPALDSPFVANQKATNESLVTKQNNINLDIKDKGNNVSNVNSSGPLKIPIRTTSTTSSKNWNK